METDVGVGSSFLGAKKKELTLNLESLATASKMPTGNHVLFLR